MSEFGLWALPPHMIGEVVKRHSIEALIPEAIRALSGHGAKAPADPIREGATLIIPVDGVLSPRGGYGGSNTTKLQDIIRTEAANDKVGALVLNVSSPGGLVYNTQETADVIFEARQAKPVVAVATTMAASAAYWLATQAGEFYASPSADVGSIGVYAAHTDESGFEDKIGMKTTLIASSDSPKKVDGHPYAPLSDTALADIQASVDESMSMFVAAVARGRGVSAETVRNTFGKGGMLSAPKGTAAGMVDGVMTLRDVVAKYSSSRARLALMRRKAEVLGALYSI